MNPHHEQLRTSNKYTSMELATVNIAVSLDTENAVSTGLTKHHHCHNSIELGPTQIPSRQMGSTADRHYSLQRLKNN